MGQLCYKRDISYQLKSQKLFYPIKRIDTNSLFRSQQMHSVRSVKNIDQIMQNQLQSDDPNIQLQNKLYQEQNNIDLIIEYLLDDSPLYGQNSFDHIWAENPQTIGSLAMMFLGFMIMREINPDELGYQYQEQVIQNNVKKIVEQNIFKQINQNLQHKSIDRVQMTVLFLVFFVEFQEYHKVLLDNQIFGQILPYSYINEKYPMGFRLAAGFILRDLYKDRQQYVQIALNDNNYINTIKDFLQSQNQQYVFEGLNSIDDLIYDSREKTLTNNKNCKQLYELNFLESLQQVQLNFMYPNNNGDSFQENESFQDERTLIMEIIKNIMTKLIQNEQIY